MNKKQPLISIIMPVYNAARFLPACLDSIQTQTHRNWELIAIDDGSKDDSYQILKDYAQKDKRIRLYKNDKNLGGPTTANRAVGLAHSKWIARMDADDIMHPNRLAAQLKALQEHPSVILIGSQCNLIDKTGKKTGKKLFPTCPKEIFNMLFWACPVQQPSVMVNANKLSETFRWYADVRICEEIDFLIRISRHGNIVNSKKTLLSYRLHDSNLSNRDNQKLVFFNQFRTRIRVVLSGQYTPTLGSIVIGFAELLAVMLLPEKALVPTFLFVRGMKNFHFDLKLPSVFPSQRRISFST